MADRRRSSDLSISDYLQAARFHPWAVVLPMVVIGVLAWLLLGRGAPVYEAEAEVLIGTTAAQDSFDTTSSDRVNDANFKDNEIKFAKGDAVLSEVGNRLGPDAPDDLDDLDVEVKADEGADLLIFTAQADTGEGAADLANLYAEVYVEETRARAVAGYTGTIESIEDELTEIRDSRTEARTELDEVNVELAGLDEDSAQRRALEVRQATLEAELGPRLTSLDSQETVLIDRLSDLRISQSLAQSGTAVVSSAAVADPDPLPSAGTRALIVGEIVGLILGLMLAVTLENMNDRLRETSEVERYFPDLPILGTVPYESSVRKRRELTVLAQPASNFSESINQVRTSLRFMTMEQGVRLVVVTSSLPSEGKTTFTTNFAWALAGLKEKVVLIDGDLRRPVAHQHFGVELAPGLTDLVIDKRPIESVEVSFEEQEGNFSIIPAGTNHGNPADFLGSTTLVDRVKEIAEESITVVDAAPVLPVSDARALAGASDLTILMIRVGNSRRSDVAAAIQNLRNAGAKSIALVLVGVKPETSTYYGDSDRKRPSGTAHPTPVRSLPVGHLAEVSPTPTPTAAPTTAPTPAQPATMPVASAQSPAGGPGTAKPVQAAAKPEKAPMASESAAKAARVTERRPGGAASPAEPSHVRTKRVDSRNTGSRNTESRSTGSRNTESRANGSRNPEPSRQSPPDPPRRSTKKATGNASTESAARRPKGPKRPPRSS